MRLPVIVLALGALLAACSGSGDAESATDASSGPDLASCQPTTEAEASLLQRKEPIPVPEGFAEVMASDMTRLAFASMGGNTICVPASWIDSIDGTRATPDGRFIAFSWSGYESFGYLLVDRTGVGMAVETGNAPLAPPSGMRFASIDLSPSGFGAQNAFAAWQIEPTGLREIGRVSEGFPMGVWSMDGWEGDHCVNLSVVRLENSASGQRDPWFVAEDDGWQPKEGRCPAA